MEYKIRKAKEQDYKQIESLQEASHFKNVSDAEKENEGFVSVKTTIPMLRKLNSDIGILVAVQNSNVIGYELPLDLENAGKIHLLDPFIERILNLKYKEKKLSEFRIIIEGQILVKKGYKGIGIAEKLHKNFIKLLKLNYDLIITEVSNQNPRSLHVHKKKLGFSVLEQYSAKGKDWYILIQDLKKY